MTHDDGAEHTIASKCQKVNDTEYICNYIMSKTYCVTH